MKLVVFAIVWQIAGVVAFQPHPKAAKTVTATTTTTASPSSSLLRSTQDGNASVPSLEGKTVYKRTLFRLQPSPDLTLYNALVIEERLRFRPSKDDPTFMEPFGPRTLLLRDGQVEEGAIGDEFCTIHVHEVPPSTKTRSSTSTLQHGGRAGAVDESLVLSLVLAAQPDACQGPMLEIAAREGLGALVGCLGAAFATQTPEERAARQPTMEDLEEDVLTVPVDHVTEKLLPTGLTSLTITDPDPVMLDLCAAQVSSIGKSKKLHVQPLDWSKRSLPMARGATAGRPEYATVALADCPLTFPETREMVRTVAHRVGPSNPSLTRYLVEDDVDDKLRPSLTPRFIHVCREGREETVYLRKYLTEGCRMNVATDYITVEKIGFAIQSIDTVPPNEEGALLDPLELEVASLEELKYQVITAQHHVDYTGGGSGEVFFPLEATDFSVGQRGSGGGSDGLEPERGSFLG
mmetsp:Transcript_10958/g.22430  ORF Transcript_10958/g.22430 Transcript_10958/m.22430 type:complete len:463 (-) Transcript_10958:47-1435(-)